MFVRTGESRRSPTDQIDVRMHDRLEQTFEFIESLRTWTIDDAIDVLKINSALGDVVVVIVVVIGLVRRKSYLCRVVDHNIVCGWWSRRSESHVNVSTMKIVSRLSFDSIGQWMEAC